MCINHNCSVINFHKIKYIRATSSQTASPAHRNPVPSCLSSIPKTITSWYLIAEMSFVFFFKFPTILSEVLKYMSSLNTVATGGRLISKYNYSHFTWMRTTPLKTHLACTVLVLHQLQNSVCCVKNDWKGKNQILPSPPPAKKTIKFGWGLMPLLMRKEQTQMLFLNKCHHKSTKIKI